MIKDKLKEWFRRYAFAEFIALILALVFSNLSMWLFGNIILSGFIGTWIDNLGFYGIITYMDLRKDIKKNGKLKVKNYLIELRNDIVEFGPAEYLDSFIIRPFCLSFLPYVISNYSFAIIVGTILADITYYVPTIASYEFRKKIFKD